MLCTIDNKLNVLIAILSKTTYAEGAKSAHSEYDHNVEQRQPRSSRGLRGSADESTDRELGLEAKNVAESIEMYEEEAGERELIRRDSIDSMTEVELKENIQGAVESLQETEDKEEDEEERDLFDISFFMSKTSSFIPIKPMEIESIPSHIEET